LGLRAAASITSDPPKATSGRAWERKRERERKRKRKREREREREREKKSFSSELR